MYIDGLSERLGKLRALKNMKAELMARRLGISVAMIYAYENGERNPSLGVLIKIAGMFNVTTDYLLGLEDKDTDKCEIKFNITDLSMKQRYIIMETIEEFKSANSCDS